MWTNYTDVADVKTADAILQVLSFIIGVYICYHGSDNAMIYIASFPVLQSLSAIVWSLFFSGKVIRLPGATRIRRTFLIILTITGVLTFIDSDLIWLVAYPMILGGPVCGILYFVITCSEIKFYRTQSQAIHNKEKENTLN